MAGNYDREERGAGRTYLQIMALTKNYLNPEDTLLDFGCATGRVSREVSQSVAVVHAIDLSSKMIAIAKETAGNHPIHYMQATIFDNRLEPASYDVILGFYILHLLEEPAAELKRMHELLKPGGLLILVTPCMGEHNWLRGLFRFLGKIGLLPRIHAFKSGDLNGLLSAQHFGIMQQQLLSGTSNQYFTVSKKTHHGFN